VGNEIDHIIKVKVLVISMTIPDYRRPEYVVAEENGFKHVFYKDVKMAHRK
jgi:hypothetical protein